MEPTFLETCHAETFCRVYDEPGNLRLDWVGSETLQFFHHRAGMSDKVLKIVDPRMANETNATITVITVLSAK